MSRSAPSTSSSERARSGSAWEGRSARARHGSSSGCFRLLHEDGLRVAVITNDLVTTEDAERLQAGGLIEPELVVGVETGACPHTAIREDPSMNIDAAERLEREHGPLDLILIESGGDNLAATFSSDLVDQWIYVIDVAAGDDIPRKRGLGLVQADLLVVNKVDLAPHVGADLDRIRCGPRYRAIRTARPCTRTSERGAGPALEYLQHHVFFDRV